MANGALAGEREQEGVTLDPLRFGMTLLRIRRGSRPLQASPRLRPPWGSHRTSPPMAASGMFSMPLPGGHPPVARANYEDLSTFPLAGRKPGGSWKTIQLPPQGITPQVNDPLVVLEKATVPSSGLAEVLSHAFWKPALPGAPPRARVRR